MSERFICSECGEIEVDKEDDICEDCLMDDIELDENENGDDE